MNEYTEVFEQLAKDRQIAHTKYDIRERFLAMAKAESVSADEVKALIDDCAKGFFTSDATLTCLRSMHKLLANRQPSISE
jgi:hypothetical protein